MSGASGIVQIHGRDYQTVAHRVTLFREEYGTEASIVTRVEDNGDTVRVRAEILGFHPETSEQYVMATGTAEEVRGSTRINRTSALENCETSAVGRALAFLGFHGSGDIASAEEVTRATALDREKVEKAVLFMVPLLEADDAATLYKATQRLTEDELYAVNARLNTAQKGKWKKLLFAAMKEQHGEQE